MGAWLRCATRSESRNHLMSFEKIARVVLRHNSPVGARLMLYIRRATGLRTYE